MSILPGVNPVHGHELNRRAELIRRLVAYLLPFVSRVVKPLAEKE